MSIESIKVAVRCRPFNQREKELGCQLVVSMNGSSTSVASTPVKTFTYDYSYWSFDESTPDFVSQEDVYRDIGVKILQNALAGFNGCLFAYGQTGSGKSYSVMGFGDSPGVIPRLINDIFNEKYALSDKNTSIHEIRVWVSYVEIYNEHIRDLLSAEKDPPPLKILDHPKLGTYIPGITESACASRECVESLMDFGNKKRVVAATQMNATSSRSHTVFITQLQCFHDGVDPDSPQEGSEKPLCAKVNLVDLAGSERQGKTGAEGVTLFEGCKINQTLSTLGMVIKELSEKVGGKNAAKAPFRSSKLTFLLKDSLAGNSKTFMLAAISPADNNLDETISTLRFASSVKRIKTVARVNRDLRDEKIENLQEEVKKLKALLAGSGSEVSLEASGALHEQVEDHQRMLDHLERSYSSHLQESADMQQVRYESLSQSGLTTNNMTGIFGVDKDSPYLLNMADDPMLAGCLLYFLAKGKKTSIGAADYNDIVLRGIGICDQLCTILNTDNHDVSLEKIGSEGRVVVQGKLVQMGQKVPLVSNDKIFLGHVHAFKLTVPLDADRYSEFISLGLEGLEDEQLALDESPSWCAVEPQLQQILKSLPASQGRSLLDEVREACRMCDEATEITRELRHEDNFIFEPGITPETANVGVSTFVRVMQSPMEPGQKQGEGLYIWSMAQMGRKLDCMRDCYNTYHWTGKLVIDELLDPWGDPLQSDIAHRLEVLEQELREARMETDRLRHEKKNSLNRTLVLWQSHQGENIIKGVFRSWAQLREVATARRNSEDRLQNLRHSRTFELKDSAALNKALPQSSLWVESNEVEGSGEIAEPLTGRSSMQGKMAVMRNTSGVSPQSSMWLQSSELEGEEVAETMANRSFMQVKTAVVRKSSGGPLQSPPAPVQSNEMDGIEEITEPLTSRSLMQGKTAVVRKVSGSLNSPRRRVPEVKAKGAAALEKSRTNPIVERRSAGSKSTGPSNTSARAAARRDGALNGAAERKSTHPSQAMSPSPRSTGISPELGDISGPDDEIAPIQQSPPADVVAIGARSSSRSRSEKQPTSSYRAGSFTPDGGIGAVVAPTLGADAREPPEEAIVRENKALRRQLEAAWELCGLLRSHTRAEHPKAVSPSTLNGISELRQLRQELKDLCGVLRSHVQEPTSQAPSGSASYGHAATANALQQQVQQVLQKAGSPPSPRAPASPGVLSPGIPKGAAPPVIRPASTSVGAADNSADGARSLSPVRAAMSPGPPTRLTTPVVQPGTATPVMPAQPCVSANLPRAMDSRGRPVPVAWGAPLVVRRPL
eukprot:gnl/MRDRNA2_/MRDRNA2_119280_c0_seq1.p1 gnl/MRDRNA2_/MRDRNA2_119280_c0~~gnl/MRDRNA2_/MRDRNA2_119280_c0_seq1.p1  ORF type:complete len:1291 (+),score=258.30 gnl/MRDRNA2_/MRDRNA2_119280_c0_seq1:198-4070(+)